MIKKGFKKTTKWCWVATETKQGWRIKLAIGNKDFPISSLLLDNEQSVKTLIVRGKVVFIHLKNK